MTRNSSEMFFILILNKRFQASLPQVEWTQEKFCAPRFATDPSHHPGNSPNFHVDRGGLVKVCFFGDVKMSHVQDPDVASGNRLQSRTVSVLFPR
jgi:hypothetical protein